MLKAEFNAHKVTKTSKVFKSRANPVLQSRGIIEVTVFQAVKRSESCHLYYWPWTSVHSESTQIKLCWKNPHFFLTFFSSCIHTWKRLPTKEKGSWLALVCLSHPIHSHMMNISCLTRSLCLENKGWPFSTRVFFHWGNDGKSSPRKVQGHPLTGLVTALRSASPPWKRVRRMRGTNSFWYPRITLNGAAACSSTLWLRVFGSIPPCVWTGFTGSLVLPKTGGTSRERRIRRPLVWGMNPVLNLSQSAPLVKFHELFVDAVGPARIKAGRSNHDKDAWCPWRYFAGAILVRNITIPN